MDVSALLITNPESPLLEEPCDDAFDERAMPSQAASMFGVPSCDSRDDPSLPERFADLVNGNLVLSEAFHLAHNLVRCLHEIEKRNLTSLFGFGSKAHLMRSEGLSELLDAIWRASA